jgi:cytosine deaminase
VSERTWLTDGRLHDGRRVDLAVDADGVVTEVVDHDPGRADSHGAGRGSAPDQRGVHLNGWLVLTAPAEPHAHLDKALTADLALNPTGDLMGAIQAWTDFAPSITADGIRGRARRAVAQSLARGLTAIRSHVNVNPEVGVVAAEAMIDVRDSVAGVVDLQLVALHGMQITGVEGAGNRAVLTKAVELGVDAVGGCPHLDRDPPGQLDIVLDLAEEAGLPLDLHVDETLDPGMLTLEVLARKILDRGFPHPVTASHCVSLGVQPIEVQRRVGRLLAEAGISVVALPQTNLYLQGRGHVSSPPRGLTAVAALCEEGVNVAAGADNLQDPFNVVGRADPMETAALMVMAAHRSIDEAWAQVSEHSRRAMGLPRAGPVAGARADLLAIDAASLREAVATASPSRIVVRSGRVVAETTVRSSTALDAP